MELDEVEPIAPAVLGKYQQTRDEDARAHVCYAPFISLRFAHTGNVQVCCYNRMYVLGNVAKDNLRDIWFGPGLKTIREQISKSDFSNGCNRCGKALTQGNFYNVPARNYDYLAQTNDPVYPSMLDFEIGNTCNYECVMCNGEYSSTIRINREKLPPYPVVYSDKFVAQLKEFIPHLREARFVGGEPFLVDIHYKIWDDIININPKTKITILTNGSLFNHRIKDLFLSGNFNISFSIDSLDAENYRRIRKGGNLDNVLSHFETVVALSKQHHRDVTLNTCFLRQNWQEMPMFVKFCNQRDIPLIFHTVYYPFHSSIWNLPYSELCRIYQYLAGQGFPAGQTQIQSNNILKYQALEATIKEWLGKAEACDEEKLILQGIEMTPLKLKFIDKLTEYYSSTEKYDAARISTITDRIQATFDKIDEAILRRTLIEMSFLPPEIIAGEFINIAEDRLIAKLQFATYTHPSDNALKNLKKLI